MPRAGSFLVRSRHGTKFHFRRRVPDDLRHVFGQGWLYRTLDTCCPLLAITRARYIAATVDQLFRQIRTMTSKNTPLRVDWTISISPDLFGTGPKVELKPCPGDSPEAIAEGARAAGVAAAALLGRGAALGPLDAKESVPADTRFNKSLRQAVAEFIGGRNLKPTTLKAYKGNLDNVVLPFFGADRLLREIEQHDVSSFVDHVRGLDRSYSTKEGYLVTLGAFGKWHRQRDKRHVPDWSVSPRMLEQSDPRPPSSKRPAFTLEQLGAIFRNASKYLDNEPAKFWVTAAVAFFGSRVEEIAQINLAHDYRHDPTTGLHWFTLNEHPDEDGKVTKSIKRSSSWRVVPIHSALVRHGFVNYLNAEMAAGAKRPFERVWPCTVLHIDRAKGLRGVKWAREISKWGGHEMRRQVKRGQLSVLPGQTYFGSMRHSFATHLKRRDLGVEDRSMLQGQSIGTVNGDTYVDLRNDPIWASEIVERELTAYADLLDAVFAAIAVDRDSAAPRR
jgi:uncharacterized protein YfaQ (DUF2300 family)